MLLKKMYDELEKLGGFKTDVNKLNEKQINFLEKNNKYYIENEELLNIIADFYTDESAEIEIVYENVEDLAEQELNNGYTIPEFLENYIDYEELGNDMINDYEGYRQLEDDRVAYISL